MKKVSVIVPIYNMEEYVEKHISYLTNQTYSNIEIMLVNDGSTDGSLAACRRAAENDSRIRVFDKENGGPSSARNLALKQASGEYVYFYDIDDAVKPNTIERLVDVMEERNADLSVCGFEIFDGKKVVKTVNKKDGLYRTGEEARKDYANQLYMYEAEGIQGAPWFKLFKMSIIREHNIEFPNIRRSEDDVFIARYVNYIDSFVMTGDILYRYYVNTCRRFWDKYRFDMFDTAVISTRYMLDIVYSWNTDNIAVRDKIYGDYFQKAFTSICFLFNPKLKLNMRKRYARIKEISKQFISEVPDDFQDKHPVFDYMKQEKYVKIYIRMALYVLRHIFD
jgi:glycosyltransferase involved in cell wall biosynthesis